ncbi:hypothetical protein GCM10027089_53550 [Nocardia thraciensis]
MAVGIDLDEAIRQLAQRFFFTSGLVLRGGMHTHAKLLGIAFDRYARFARHRHYGTSVAIPKRGSILRTDCTKEVVRHGFSSSVIRIGDGQNSIRIAPDATGNSLR